MTKPPPVFPPEFLENRSPLPNVLLKDKREDTYITGFRAIGWNPEAQFNYGGNVQGYDSVERETARRA